MGHYDTERFKDKNSPQGDAYRHGVDGFQTYDTNNVKVNFNNIDEPILAAGMGSVGTGTGVGSVDKGMIYAHTNWPYAKDQEEFKIRKEHIKEGIEYKFNEGRLIGEFKDYIDSTYDAHYCTSGIQSSEVIIDRGRGMGFFLGNVDKYSSRYGNKGEVSDHRKDLMKVLHYALLALHTHDIENA
jgi:hypothetical protein|tara:strand:+ start:1184 stop:1735 length:552 start_codon:yes stop_codon:yes gene_type:complete